MLPASFEANCSVADAFFFKQTICFVCSGDPRLGIEEQIMHKTNMCFKLNER